MKKQLFLMALTSALMIPISAPVYSETYQWKTITSVTVGISLGVATQWYVYVGDITADSGSVSLDSTADFVGRPQGMLAARAMTGGGYYWGTIDVATTYPPPGLPYSGTWRQVLADSVGHVKSVVSIRNNSVAGGSSEVCFGYIPYSGTNYNFETFVFPPGAGEGVNCIVAPPPNEWCAMTVPEVTLNFGTLMLDQAVGKTADTSVGVSCTSSSISYVLKLQTGNTYIPLNNGMRANLGLGDTNTAPGSTTYSGSQSDLKLTGTLAGTPTSSGAFNGSGVLMVVYQ
ncbi:hypothetical protein [Entomohabitans teleogrylli]|uniref:hypothetical protein n=1 Tax=Entomohabitans teleogrylli TaxID=1384589 RepID=UPI00073D92D3|nr:hypothetical protein [Entomohabitans teleogrylli]